MNDNLPSYYAVLPAEVRYNKNICSGAKLLYGEITALCTKEGFCWASNTYFSKLYDNDTNTVSRWISELTKEGFINCVVDKKAGNVRRIYLSPKINIPIFKNQYSPIPESVGNPIPKNREHSNTSINTTVNNKTIVLSPAEEIKKRKLSFFNKLSDFRNKNQSKYPSKVYNDFYNYWTEVDELNGGTKMRLDKHQIFEIGKRLATFRKYIKDEEFASMWKADDEKNKVQELNFSVNRI